MVSTPLQALSAASYLGDCDDFVVVALKPADRVSLAQFTNTLQALFDPSAVVSLPFGLM